MIEIATAAAGDGNSKTTRSALRAALSRERITYMAAGATTALVYYVFLGLGLLVTGDRVPYLFLVAACYSATVPAAYPVYRRLVFRDAGGSWLTGCLRFYAVGASFLAVSMTGVPLLVELAGFPVLVAQGLIIIASPPLTYLIHNKWTFRSGQPV
ncbi:hypothetical protein Psi02_25260 [Planotetraspora silvatica]|uniref:GtrA/DPMS transmembrane domain-containing protein n=1 Tax=Planotetraspora silvatica TaxID=234614 RepID=A0A8J3XL99_9ACTN|nr:GtrA family protein [Planotetraspora silvatica]GII46102.1 hypothetical protein Psi02_25260 [Planotetraspora silvatica]